MHVSKPMRLVVFVLVHTPLDAINLDAGFDAVTTHL